MAAGRSRWWLSCLLPASLFLVGRGAGTTAPPRPEPATLILKNGDIYTANDEQPHVEAVAVRDAQIVYVGGSADAAQFEGPNTRVIDLHGATVVPGLTDSHYHLSGVGQREMTLNLEGTKSLSDLLTRVKARVAQAKPSEWVTGRGWIETSSKARARFHPWHGGPKGGCGQVLREAATMA